MKPRLLVLEFHHLGDALLSFPFIRSALEKYEVWVCCRPAQKEVFELIIPEGNILVWEPFWTGASVWNQKEILEQGLRLKALQAETVVCGWADPRVQMLMLLSGAAKRVGFPLNRGNYFTWEASGTADRLWWGKLFQWLGELVFRQKFLTTVVQRESREQPHWKDWQQVGSVLGLEVTLERPWVYLPWQSQTAVGSGIKWLLHVGARLPEKRWPIEGFVEVVKSYLESEKLDWVCVAPAGECGVLPSCLEQKRAETCNWKALVKEVFKADAVLCHDSAVAHLAVALGKPVVSLFGHRSSCWFAPYGNEHLVVGSSRKEPWGGLSLGIDPANVVEMMRETVRIEKPDSGISVLGKDGNRN